MRLRTVLAVCLLAMAGALPSQSVAGEPALVRGRLVDPAGRPVEGAAIRASAEPSPFGHGEVITVDELLAEPDTRSDAEGRFELRADPAGSLRIAREGFVALQVTASSAARQSPTRILDLSRIVLSPAAVYVGTVRDVDGEPVAGARIVARPLVGGSGEQGAAWWNSRSETRSDDRGVFRLRCAPRTAAELSVIAAGYRLWSEGPVAEGTPLQIDLEPAGFVRGRVVDGAGLPREGLELEIAYETGGPTVGDPFVTGVDGRFEATLVAPGRYRIGGYDIQARERFAGPVLDGPADDVLVQPLSVGDEGLAGRRDFEVVVRAAGTGEPVVGARIGSRSTIGGKLPTFRTLEVPGSAGPWGDDDLPTTDAEGRANLELPRSGEKRRNTRLAVRAPGYGGYFESFDLEAAGETPIEIELRPEAVVTGRIVDGDGEPVVGARVLWARRSDRRGSSKSFNGNRPHAVVTDEGGRYRLAGVPRSEVDIVAAHPDFLVPPVAILDATDQRAFTVDFTLRKGREIAVHFPADMSSSGWVASCRSDHRAARRADGQQADYRSGVLASKPFDSEGLALFVNRLPGKTRLSVSRMAKVATPYALHFELPSVDGSEDARLDISRALLATGRIAGKLVTEGLPFERFAVRALVDSAAAGQHNHSYRVPVDAAGRWAFELPPGDYGLVVFDLQTWLPVLYAEENTQVRADEISEAALEPRCAPVTVRLQPQNGGDGPVLLGDLEVRALGEPVGGRRRSGGTLSNWSGARILELLLLPGRYQLVMQDGARQLTATGLYRIARIEGPVFEVQGGAAREVTFPLPAPTPTEDIDR